MTPEVFKRGKLGATCLSQWQLSLWATGEASSAERAVFAAHTGGCASCTALWDRAQAAQRAAETMALPAYIHDIAATRVSTAAVRRLARDDVGLSARAATYPGGASRYWGALAGALVAACLIAVLGVRSGDSDGGERSKGQAALSVAVMHDGMVHEALLTDVGALAPGDRVRLRAPSGRSTWQLLQKESPSGWEDVFAGNVAADGFVPLSLEIAPGAQVKVRLLVCENAPAAGVQGDARAKGCTAYAARF